MGGYNSGRRADTPDTGDCLRLSLSDLRREGALKRQHRARREMRWRYCGAGQASVNVAVIVDVDCLEPIPCLKITGRAFGQNVDQLVEIVSKPQPFGGERFFALCPLTGRRCTVLVLPPGKTFFASVPGWDVPHASSRERSLGRALRAMDRLEARENSMSKYVRYRTRDLVKNLKAARRDVILAAERKLMFEDPKRD